MASQLSELATMYSTFAKLSVIGACFLLNQETIHEPKLKQHLEVFLWSLTPPTQSNSINLCSTTLHHQHISNQNKLCP